ncbi:unnamed protein product [Phytomonas sp. EM1]|nr:unnamed protein product [Phytomonas sp. EM1]|eukprot:CCW59874.1 unnamed protein product [Phytomonas sp. isolate EM1]
MPGIGVVDDIRLDLPHRFMQALQAVLIFRLQHLIQLHIPIHPPGIHILKPACFDLFAYREHLAEPSLPGLVQVDVKELGDGKLDFVVEFVQSTVGICQEMRGNAELANVFIRFLLTFPRELVAAARGDRLLKTHRGFQKHRLGARDDILRHAIVSVRDLLQQKAFGVILEAFLRDLLHALGNAVIKRGEDAHFLNQLHQTLRIVHLHLPFLVNPDKRSVGIEGEGAALILHIANPITIHLLRIILNLLEKVSRGFLEILRAAKIRKNGGAGFEHFLHAMSELPQPDHVIHHTRHETSGLTAPILILEDRFILCPS